MRIQLCTIVGCLGLCLGFSQANAVQVEQSAQLTSRSISLTASPATIAPGGTAQLTPRFTVGRGSISPGVGAVVSGVPIAVQPAQSTTYTLTVTYHRSRASTSATITVSSGLPAIQSFAASPASIDAGASATLSATYTGGSGSIDQGVGPIVSGGSVVVTPSATTTYALTVTSPSGQTATQTAVVSIASTTGDSCPTSLRSTGTIHYFCDCQAGAQAGCVAGSDSNDGLSAGSPKQTLSAATTAFNALNAGDTVAFCQGGAWSSSSGMTFGTNARCSGTGSLRALANSTTCDLASYAPSWGGTNKPVLRSTGNQTLASIMLQFWNTAGLSGVRVMNLDLEGGGTGPGGTDLALRGIVTDSKNSNFLICGNTVNGWTDGLQINADNGNSSNIDVWSNTVTACSQDGLLGSGNGLTVDGNTFDDTGSGSGGNHYLYIDANSAVGTGPYAIINNAFKRSNAAASACQGVMLVVHGAVDAMNIENNTLDGGAGVTGACYGIGIDDGGYPVASYFRNLTVRRNYLINIGNQAMEFAEAPGAIIENNIIVQGSSAAYGIVAPSRAHRTTPVLDDTMNHEVIRNNTIYVSPASTNTTGIYTANEGTGHVIANNAIAFAVSTGEICFNMGLSPASYAYDNHNLCNGSSRWETSHSTLAGWQSASGFDAASLTSAPQFTDVNHSPLGFEPQVGSPLIGAGESVQAPTVDYLNRTRPSAPSIGALEP
ncbi:MAG TPA: hypothetical protein VLW85_05325 [Myxococcales bacterium]|nr:hypothetical protein [Myxococcales bacterium]